MNVLELFAGIGGFGLGLERAGATVVGACEIDDPARGVYADHWPDVPLFPDVTEMQADDLGTTRVDLIAAGFPCQDLSVAGRREGLDGARSGLFWEIVRLADALSPRWLVLENVPGLLSSNDGRDMGIVVGALGDLGYGWAYRVLDAQHFGVPQRRRRVFIVGCLGDGAAPAAVLLEPEGSDRDPSAGRAARPSVAATLTSGVGGGRPPGRRAEDDVNLVATVTSKWAKGTGGPAGDEAQNLIAFDAAQITHPENRVNPQPGDPAMPLAATGQPMVAETLTTGSNGGRIDKAPLVTHSLTAEGSDASEDGTGRGTPLVAYAIEPETGQGADLRARQVDIAPAITATSEAKSTDRGVRLASATAVRRLTPTECERLQGFPDGWTATSNGKAQSDSARYRQLGNAVAVPVVEWIARRLVAVDADLEDDDLVECPGCGGRFDRAEMYECADAPPVERPALHCAECLAECLTYGPCQAEATREWQEEHGQRPMTRR